MVTIRRLGYKVDVPGIVVYRNKKYTVMSSSNSFTKSVVQGYAANRRKLGRPSIVKTFTAVKYRGQGIGKRKQKIYVLYGRKK